MGIPLTPFGLRTLLPTRGRKSSPYPPSAAHNTSRKGEALDVCFVLLSYAVIIMCLLPLVCGLRASGKGIRGMTFL
jgi:hypothetical protein